MFSGRQAEPTSGEGEEEPGAPTSRKRGVMTTGTAINPTLSDLIDLGGAGLVITDFAEGETAAASSGSGAIRIGLSHGDRTPCLDIEAFDILLSDDPAAPQPWVGLRPDRFWETLAQLRRLVEAQPAAASVAAQTLRLSLCLSFEQALIVESLAYSLLLASPGFRAWRSANPARRRSEADEPRILVDVGGAAITITLNRPWARNAVDADMRDQLFAALEFALAHPDRPPIVLRGLGPAFCAGGDLDEFGSAGDLSVAHLIRCLRSPARLAHALGDRLQVEAHGACIGAGIEVAAAAAVVTAQPNAAFRLPEVSMGLIPGAGGTASIPRRIGRHRACYMAISGAVIDVETALSWGLIDAVGP